MNRKEQFPILKRITYLDSAAYALKPIEVVEVATDFYTNYSVSDRTSDSYLGIKVKEKVVETRKKMADLIDAESEEIIFTQNASESLNLFALMASKFIKENDEIILHEYNHSSNAAPWIEMANKNKAKVIVTKNIINNITEKTKIISLSQMSNNMKHDINIQKIYNFIQDKNIVLVNDAAQSIVHENVSLINCDVIALSANKMYGPTGVGVLAVKKELLDLLDPVFSGGGSIEKIDEDLNVVRKKNVSRFEVGTANFAGIFQFNKALDFLPIMLNKKNIEKLEGLSRYLFLKLNKLKNFQLLNETAEPIVIFKHNTIPSQDIASYLGHKNVYIRAGDFCAKLNKMITKSDGFLRVSLLPYNEKKDIDILISLLKKEEDYFEYL